MPAHPAKPTIRDQGHQCGGADDRRHVCSRPRRRSPLLACMHWVGGGRQVRRRTVLVGWGLTGQPVPGRSLRDRVPPPPLLRTVPYGRPTHKLCNSPCCRTMPPRVPLSAWKLPTITTIWCLLPHHFVFLAGFGIFCGKAPQLLALCILGILLQPQIRHE